MTHYLYQGDCLDLLRQHEPVTCIFADPPDNIRLDYDEFSDNRNDAEYVAWLKDLLELLVLRADIIWFSFNAKWTFDVGRIFQDLISRYATSPRKLIGKPCVQVFTFGQHNKNDLGNNHRPLWRLMWSDAKLYPEQIKVPSWRQRNGDKRAAAGGRVPGDVFDMQYARKVLEGEHFTIGDGESVIRGTFLPIESGDVFDFPRVTGNSKQRSDWHPTQLHEDLVERCLKLSTLEGESVLDPFGGSGTTLRVARRIGRPCTLFEISKGYCDKIAEENGLRPKRRGWAA